MLLFTRPTRVMLPTFSRPPVLCDNNEGTHTVLINRQPQISEDVDTHENIPFLTTGSTVAVQQEDGRLWTHGTIVKLGSEETRAEDTKKSDED